MVDLHGNGSRDDVTHAFFHRYFLPSMSFLFDQQLPSFLTLEQVPHLSSITGCCFNEYDGGICFYKRLAACSATYPSCTHTPFVPWIPDVFPSVHSITEHTFTCRLTVLTRSNLAQSSQVRATTHDRTTLFSPVAMCAAQTLYRVHVST